MTGSAPRVGVVGAGVAGSLLAWRLAGATPWPLAGGRPPERPESPGVSVTLIAGAAPSADATAASGGMVRGYEPEPANCRLAAASLAELLANPALTCWAGYRETGSVYFCPAGPDLSSLLAIVNTQLPGSARLSAVDGLPWSGLPAGARAVVERRAGFVSPNSLRRHVIADLRGRGATVVVGRAWRARPAGGGVACRVGDAELRFDALVLAAGRWTPRLLAGEGFPAAGLRTKLIQYGVYRAAGPLPPSFIDDTCGLYGRPDGHGRLLLGVASGEWDVDPDHPSADVALERRAAGLAGVRFPGLRLTRERLVVAADCYAEPPLLALRPVTAGLYTFTGGSGGAAKTALAASSEAASGVLAGLGLPDRPGTGKPAS